MGHRRSDTEAIRARHEYVYRRAYELAASGSLNNSESIVLALVREGYPEARELLDSNIIRSDLQRIFEEQAGRSGRT
jgi:hypothetical protein